jgi:excisionase family DNA binding protein
MDGWGKIPQAAKYCGVSARTFRPYLKKGLRHVRLPSGTILIKFTDIDEFLAKYEVNSNEVDQLADEIMSELDDG